MSYLVLHMDKFKKDAVRGIQSHNNRERESHSNPDIDYERSANNYDLLDQAVDSYAEAIQSRIDDLLLVKAVRKDAVHMCGLIVSSDSAFFEKLSPEDTRRFFEESNSFLTKFVGKENVISAMVHMDEKTPHMHFLHVPVTSEGRLNANSIYTRDSLKKLQNDLPRFLQDRGFNLQRGVEQIPGASKKHLATREFKQQQEMLQSMQQEETSLRQRLQEIAQQADEAEKILRENEDIPEASMFSYRSALEKAQSTIVQQKKALASKHFFVEQNGKMQTEIHALTEEVARLKTEIAKERKQNSGAMEKVLSANSKMISEVEEHRKFLLHPRVALLHSEYVRARQQEAKRLEAELRHEAQERELKEQRQRQEQLRQQQEQEKLRASQIEQSRPGMRMR